MGADPPCRARRGLAVRAGTETNWGAVQRLARHTHPVDAVAGDGYRGLRTRAGAQGSRAQTRAIRTVTVPLGKTAASGGT